MQGEISGYCCSQRRFKLESGWYSKALRTALLSARKHALVNPRSVHGFRLSTDDPNAGGKREYEMGSTGAGLYFFPLESDVERRQFLIIYLIESCKPCRVLYRQAGAILLSALRHRYILCPP